MSQSKTTEQTTQKLAHDDCIVPKVATAQTISLTTKLAQSRLRKTLTSKSVEFSGCDIFVLLDR